MRCRKELSEAELHAEQISMLREQAYNDVCYPMMNRKERRTAKGRMLVAQAEAAALQAEVDYLRQVLSERLV